MCVVIQNLGNFQYKTAFVAFANSEWSKKLFDIKVQMEKLY